MLLGIYKGIQLFGLAFSMSASALVVTAVSTGHLDKTSLHSEVTEFGLSYLEENPEVMSRAFMMAAQVAQQQVQEPAAVLPSDNSLAGLRARIAGQN